MFKKKDMHDFSVSMLKFVTVMFCFVVEHVFFLFLFFSHGLVCFLLAAHYFLCNLS